MTARSPTAFPRRAERRRASSHRARAENRTGGQPGKPADGPLPAEEQSPIFLTSYRGGGGGRTVITSVPATVSVPSSSSREYDRLPVPSNALEVLHSMAADAVPVAVEGKDGKIESEEPEGLIGYVSVPIGRWMFNIPYS